MEPLTIILIGILMAILLYKPFKKISDNGWTIKPMAQIWVWPAMVSTLTVWAITIGWRVLLELKDEYPWKKH